jgi:hypothetical protein
MKSTQVALLIFNPVINGKKLSALMNWNDPARLAETCARLMAAYSDGMYKPQIVKTIHAGFPTLESGQCYTPDTYLAAARDDTLAIRSNGSYAMADYTSIMGQHGFDKAVSEGTIDEVWLMGGPLFGFYESRWVGQGARWCNSPGLDAPHPGVILMGFNYERTVDLMVHSFGHRAESLLLARDPAAFTEFTQKYGTIHTSPGLTGDYQYTISHEAHMKFWHKALPPRWWKYVSPDGWR